MAAVASKDPGRFATDGVLVERLGVKRCAATATDGRMLLHAEWDEADPRDYPHCGRGWTARL